MHRKLIATLAAAAALAVPATAIAHVVVTPGEVEADSFAMFTLRVPTEENVPTTRVELLVPDGVTVYSMQPTPGWRIAFQRSSGRITSIVVKGKLPPERFQQFYFMAGTPKEEGTITWKAIQTYRNGKVVRWTGEPGDEEASTTTVTAATPGEGH
jgi:uncharacterized protein YcnI